jgi:hypothetical protein
MSTDIREIFDEAVKNSQAGSSFIGPFIVPGKDVLPTEASMQAQRREFKATPDYVPFVTRSSMAAAAKVTVPALREQESAHAEAKAKDMEEMDIGGKMSFTATTTVTGPATAVDATTFTCDGCGETRPVSGPIIQCDKCRKVRYCSDFCKSHYSGKHICAV